MRARLLYNPIQIIELLLASATTTFAAFLAMPPYDSLIAEGFGTLALVLTFSALALLSGIATMFGLGKNSSKLRRWGTAGIFLSMFYVSLLLVILAGTTTGMWAITLAHAFIAAVCHIYEKVFD
jgi:hypothetical protein